MINRTKYDGFDSVEIISDKMRAVVVYEIGPRIAFFGKPKGKNLLYWKKDGMERNGWKLYGGHRVWLTRPMADESEDTYLPDNDPCSLEIQNNTVIVTSPENSVNHLVKGMEIELVSENTIKVRNFVRNKGGLIYSGGVWSPTCIVPDDTQMIIPLGQEDATWDVVRIVIPRVFAGNTTQLEDSQVKFQGNDLVVTPAGKTMKRVCCAPKGKVILKSKEYTFEKYSPYNKLLKYPFEGCNVACFVGPENFMGELETFGGETDIPPGAEADNTEYWSLR